MIEKMIRRSYMNLANIRRLRAWEKRRDHYIQNFLAGEPVQLKHIPQLLWNRRQAG